MNTHHQPRKRFGQHFLIDLSVLDNIVASLHINPTDYLVEIGPGKGILTQHLVKAVARHLDIIEIDRDLVEILKQKFIAASHLTIHSGDILHFDWQTLSAHKPMRIIGNLPYNITTPLLFQLFALGNSVQDLYFLLQKEVVQRLTASVGSHNYSRLSVMAQYYSQLTELFEVSSQAFSPPPKVESAFIHIVPYPIPPFVANDFNIFSAVVKEAFTYRRKTLANCLRKLVSAETLTHLNIDPNLRPQQLTVENFVKISNNISS